MYKVTMPFAKGTTRSNRTFDKIDVENLHDDTVKTCVTAYKDLLDGYTIDTAAVTKYETHNVEIA